MEEIARKGGRLEGSEGRRGASVGRCCAKGGGAARAHVCTEGRRGEHPLGLVVVVVVVVDAELAVRPGLVVV